jgi:hypothetical protein
MALDTVELWCTGFAPHYHPITAMSAQVFVRSRGNGQKGG